MYYGSATSTPFGGSTSWTTNGTILIGTGQGVWYSNFPAFYDGNISADIYFPDVETKNAALFVKVSNFQIGNMFNGYEVAFGPGLQGVAVLLYPAHSWIKFVSYTVPVRQWISLKVVLKAFGITVYLNGIHTLEVSDFTWAGGSVGLDVFGGTAYFQNLQVYADDSCETILFTGLCVLY